MVKSNSWKVLGRVMLYLWRLRDQMSSRTPGAFRCQRFQRLQFNFSLAISLLILSPLTATSQAAPLAAHSPQKRWLYPCNGASAISATDDRVVQDGNASDMDVTAAELADSFHTISTKANRLKRHIRELKDVYVKQRFRDDSIVQDLEQMGIRLAGMPETVELTIDSVTNVNMIETIHHAFEHLARVAVFIDQARIGESLASNEPISYERHFQHIEDHHDHGLYWLMCSLQRVVRQIRRPIPSHVVDSVLRMRVVEVDRNSMRHTRDYLVLRDFERILERVTVEFASLGQTQRQRPHNWTYGDSDEGSGATTV